MILHIVPDEKFIDAAYRAFEDASPDNNEFVIISHKQPLKYIKITPIRFVEWTEYISNDFINTLNNYEMVILHWLDEIKFQLLRRADKSVRFVWLGWGGDYYDLILDDEKKLLLPKSLDLFQKYHLLKPDLLKPSLTFRARIKQWFKRKRNKTTHKSQLVNRINYFAPVLHEDYELLLNALPDFTPKYLSWNYGTLEDDLIKGFQGQTISGDNILIGNSSTYTNNHLDVFEMLSSLQLNTQKILCPLSYGDQQYREDIIEAGLNQFGDNFSPITDFIGIEDYVQLLSSCSSVIMGHLRQQALGNIVIMLYLGAKVFLDTRSPVYRFFKKNNAVIYSHEEIKSKFTGCLTVDEIQVNRDVLHQFWSREIIRKKTIALIDTVATGNRR